MATSPAPVTSFTLYTWGTGCSMRVPLPWSYSEIPSWLMVMHVYSVGAFAWRR